MNPIHVLLCLVSFLPAAAASPQERGTQTQPAQSLAAERRELAEIRLLLAAERDYQGAKTRLAKLGETLAAREEAGAEELREAVARLDLEVRRALGEAAPAAGTAQDRLERAVEDALLRDFEFLRQLGTRAVPAVVDAIQRQPDVFPTDPGRDALVLLAELDFFAADRLALELLEYEGFLWRKRLGRLLARLELSREGLWSSDIPARWRGEGFARSAERHAEDPDVGLDALGFLTRLAERGWRSPAFDVILERALRSPEPPRRKLATTFVRRWPQFLGEARLEALLGEGDAELRVLAARALMDAFPGTSALLGHAGDSSPEVRAAVVWYLQGIQHGGRGWTGPEEDGFFELLRDPHDGVAGEAWKAFFELPTLMRAVDVPLEQHFDPQNPPKFAYEVLRDPPSDDAFRRLVQTETRPGRRARLVGAAKLVSASLGFELMLVLAADPDPEVLGAIAGSLSTQRVIEEPAAALRVAGALLDNPALRDPLRVQQDVLRMTVTRATSEALVRWLLQRGDELLRLTIRGGSASFQLERVLRLDPGLVVAYVARMHALSEEFARGLCTGRFGGSPELSRAFRGLAADETRSVSLRALALRGALAHGTSDAELVASACALAAAPGWRDARELERAREDFSEVVEELGGPGANAVILQVLSDPERPEGLATILVEHLDESAAGAAEIVALVLGRGFGRDEWSEPVAYVLRAMGRAPALQDAEALTAAARMPQLSSVALGAIGRLRDPRYLPLLSGIVARPESATQRDRAVEALFGYLDAEAVEPLLAAAASVTDPELRDRCLAQIEKIREYQDAKERWATRKARVQTREQVIAELVAQLDAKSDEVKVQAIRALATWEAVEVMPRLIELSAAGSKSVAAAARAALDRLNERRED